MQRRARGRSSYSSSSNETVLEACSSPPSGYALALTDAEQGMLPSQTSIVALSRRLASNPPEAAGRTGYSHNVAKERTVPGEKEAEEIEGNDAHGHDDSEESIDWDADSDQDTVHNAPQPRRVVRRAMLPQTMGFHLDWWIARVATAAVNLDFKVLCASMMLWREKNEVLQIPTSRTKSVPQTLGQEHDSCANSPLSQNTRRSPSQGPLLLEGAHRCSTSMLDWDVLLKSIKRASELMHRSRKWRIRGKKNAAGWCRWGAGRRVFHRGEFVEEAEVGYEVKREVDGQTWMIKLGYRRNDAVVEDMDLDGGMDSADETIATEQGAGGEEVPQETLDSLVRSNSGGVDVVMGESPGR
ncbi:hypothetical protein Z517_10177 [Fonsecaea pedrosoi CBS 271.37]|uniref:Uncharacterized protein n=1 Tax=Fonsecaea pedrosoi CBS 271.37 TaxID=1442368 RepID=A0A0D2DCR9_9EURO|nr:uncharacterized protein Z517_10177 [Fonsecaea pedrosoi CBS 271.37]KIW75436.1 hypothetical protein Z517_10177 [Fonsecaea pedrosoi CBS 271.37]